VPRQADPAKIARASRLYHSGGLSAREVAKVMEVDERTVRRWLGDTTRRTGPRGRTDVTDARVAEFHREGCGPTEIARLTGLSRGAVRKRLARLADEYVSPHDSTEGEQDR
jgi:DNA-directed RNA polymerase specialized sigma24 family protein